MILISRIWNFETNIIFCNKTKFHFVSVANPNWLYKSIIIEYCIIMFLFVRDNKIINQCLFSVMNTRGLGAIILIRPH